MNASKTSHTILELMRKHELALAGLYSACANKFPEYREFWDTLSNEEVEHAELIIAIADVVANNPDDFIVDRFPEVAIKHSIEYVNELKERVYMSSFQLKNALSEAMYLEQALLENKYFQIFEGDSQQIKHILSVLSESTAEHYQRVRKAWLEKKSNN